MGVLQAKKLSAEQVKQRNKDYFVATAKVDTETAQLMQSILKQAHDSGKQ
jgi:hypothetical protein